MTWITYLKGSIVLFALTATVAVQAADTKLTATEVLTLDYPFSFKEVSVTSSPGSNPEKEYLRSVKIEATIPVSRCELEGMKDLYSHLRFQENGKPLLLEVYSAVTEPKDCQDDGKLSDVLLDLGTFQVDKDLLKSGYLNVRGQKVAIQKAD